MRTKETKGITLVALVITIVILLILAGVGLNMVLGENGIITKAKLAKQMSEVSNEKEAIQLDVTLARMEEALDSKNKYYVGTPLYDKTLENGDKWCILVNNETMEQYGTGYNHIEKGTEINNYGKTQYEWLVNYNSGDVIELNEKYTELSYKSSLAVTDGLIFNADPLNMSDANSWGDGVKLYGFDDENETGGYEENALVFDGVNDYITIDGNLNVSNEITLEFYGNTENFGNNTYSFVPFFSAYNGRYADLNGLCMRLFSLQKRFAVTNFGFGASCGNSEVWENEDAQHNIKIPYNVELNQDVMFTVTYDHNSLTYKLFANGTIVKEAKLDKAYWENFRDNDIPAIQYFQIGRGTWNWITENFKGKMYSARIYNKVLSDDEVLENYNKTVIYHNVLEN